MSTKAVLVVEHQATCPPAWVGEWLTEAGCDLQVCRPYAGDSLPGDLTAYAGLLVLGGTMGANDDATVRWLPRAKALIREAADTGVPTLGICLGHQLAAVALGGVVGPDPLGKTVGLQAVGWSLQAPSDPLLGPLVGERTLAVQWNDDTVVRLPPGAVALARGRNGRVQAARYAPSVWGVQWHPEADADVVSVWAARDRPTAAARGLDVDAALDDVAAHTRRLRQTWQSLAAGFAELCARRRSAPAPRPSHARAADAPSDVEVRPSARAHVSASTPTAGADSTRARR